MIWPTFEGKRQEICDQVHAWAIRNFTWVSDWDRLGIPDHWPSPDEIEDSFAKRGHLLDDCDGFAAMCRHILSLHGIRSRFVLCYTPSGYHAVCEADGLVFCNMQSTVASTQDLERVGYVWDRMGGYDNDSYWTMVKLSSG